MKKRFQKAQHLRSRGAEIIYGAILLLFFTLGVLGGCYLCDRLDMSEELALYLSAFLAHSGERFSVSLWKAAGLYFRYPLFAVLMALLPAGFILMPFFLLLMGAELSFSVAAFFAVLGKSGLLVALCIFGIRSAIVLPCCFVIACRAFSCRKEKPARLFCLPGILGAGICLECFLIPQLLPRILAGINF